MLAPTRRGVRVVRLLAALATTAIEMFQPQRVVGRFTTGRGERYPSLAQVPTVGAAVPGYEIESCKNSGTRVD